MTRKCTDIRICEYCNKEFFRPPSLLKKHIFCSMSCNGLWMKHIRKTEDHPLYKGIRDSNSRLYRQKAKINNPKYFENRRVNSVIYRIRRRGLGGSITRKEWENIKFKANFACLSCTRKEPEIKLVADHIIPVARWEEWINKNPVKYKCGDKENIQPLCITCNCKKWTKLPSDYKDKERLEQEKQIELGYTPNYHADIKKLETL